MKSAQMVKRILAAAILAVGWLAQPAEAASIRIDPATQGKNVGDAVTADILVDLGATEAVGGVSLFLSFNPAILKGIGFTNDPNAKMGFALNPLNDFGSGFAAGGASPLELFFLADASLPDFASLHALQGAGFKLATVNFTAVGPGLSPLTLSAAPGPAGFLSDALGNALLITQVTNGSVCVGAPAGCVQQTPVPEPATLTLLGVGVSALIARRRRKTARS